MDAIAAYRGMNDWMGIFLRNAARSVTDWSISLGNCMKSSVLTACVPESISVQMRILFWNWRREDLPAKREIRHVGAGLQVKDTDFAE